MIDWILTFTRENLIFILLCIGMLCVVMAVLLSVLESLLRKSSAGISDNAGLTETLQQTPFLLVVLLDLLDLVFDVFAAPFVWVLLGRYNLKSLRNVSTLEAIIPGTQLIPTMTLCWIAVRVFKIRL